MTGMGSDSYQMTREEKTEPDIIAIKDLFRLFNEYFLPKRNASHKCGEFCWTKQTKTETPEDLWRSLKDFEKKLVRLKEY